MYWMWEYLKNWIWYETGYTDTDDTELLEIESFILVKLESSESLLT